jgi:hypothetical protein
MVKKYRTMSKKKATLHSVPGCSRFILPRINENIMINRCKRVNTYIFVVLALYYVKGVGAQVGGPWLLNS